MDRFEQNAPAAQERDDLRQHYKERGFQQQSLKDYQAIQKMQLHRKKIRLPRPLQFILATPFILLLCIGLFFIPFMFYLFFVSL